jgi:hypothetical protein
MMVELLMIRHEASGDELVMVVLEQLRDSKRGKLADQMRGLGRTRR